MVTQVKVKISSVQAVRLFAHAQSDSPESNPVVILNEVKISSVQTMRLFAYAQSDNPLFVILNKVKDLFGSGGETVRFIQSEGMEIVTLNVILNEVKDLFGSDDGTLRSRSE